MKRINKILNILDMPMGTGKTTGIINYIKENKNKKYIFVSPYLKQPELFKSLKFNTPSDDTTKLSSLKLLINKNENIYITHTLFSMFDNRIINELENKTYTLIIDESINLLTYIPISKDDINILIKSDYISIDNENKVKFKKYTGDFKQLKKMADNDSLYFINNLFIFKYRVEIFNLFESIFILTYLFRGSNMKAYFDMYNFEYRYYKVITDYKIVEGIYDDYNFRMQMKELINLYDGKLNDIGEDTYALSKKWFNARKRKAEHIKLKNNLYNYFRHIINSKSDENMYSVFSDFEHKYKGDRYSKGFVPCNCIATNEYRHKSTLAYALNIFINPNIVNMFSHYGSNINKDDYALCQLIQWIYRSRIRDNQSINLYLPSKRMRNILISYLEK